MYSSPPDDSDDQAVADLVMTVARRLRHRWVHGLAPWGLSPHQGRALRVVGRGERLRLSDLAAALRIAPRSATEVVDGLVEKGLVERVPDPSDRRATYVEPTAAGRRTTAEIEASRASDAEELFASVPEADRAHLTRILGSLLAATEQPPRPQP